jgi:hypothetical protein
MPEGERIGDFGFFLFDLACQFLGSVSTVKGPKLTRRVTRN